MDSNYESWLDNFEEKKKKRNADNSYAFGFAKQIFNNLNKNKIRHI